jgi:hypothetical protein
VVNAVLIVEEGTCAMDPFATYVNWATDPVSVLFVTRKKPSPRSAFFASFARPYTDTTDGAARVETAGTGPTVVNCVVFGMAVMFCA